MARAVAGYDYDKARAIGVWPVVELLEAYEAIAIERATAEFRHSTLIWASRYPITFSKKTPKPPELPPILRKRND